jgi:hypothetical protein
VALWFRVLSRRKGHNRPGDKVELTTFPVGIINLVIEVDLKCVDGVEAPSSFGRELLVHR